MMEEGLTRGPPGLLAPRTQNKSPSLSGLSLQSKSVGGGGPWGALSGVQSLSSGADDTNPGRLLPEGGKGLTAQH